MNRMIMSSVLLSAVLLVTACQKEVQSPLEEQSNEPDRPAVERENTSSTTHEEERPLTLAHIEVDENGYPIEEMPTPTEPTYIKGHLIASKRFPLPPTYNPGESVEARAAFERLAETAKREAGITYTAFSTFRSYDYQVGLYDRYVQRDGQAAADTYSARPGYSEHQTGLAFDIGEVGNEADFASNRFADTEAGRWLRDHAHRFGFIMRYPEGKEDITGYMYESWHFRYVGEEAAAVIYENDWTLEQYVGLVP